MTHDEIVRRLRWLFKLRVCGFTRKTDCETCHFEDLCNDYAHLGTLQDEAHTAAADLIESQQAKIERLEAENRWIPVSKSLPINNQKVLICWEGSGPRGNRIVIDTSVFKTQWGGKIDVFVGVGISFELPATHWRPLPGLPEKG